MTPLHEAVGSEEAVPEVIRSMVDVIVKANNWSLVDAVDCSGNTALHVAARRGRADVIPELTALNPSTRNEDGDTPFHLAARAGHPYCLEMMLQVGGDALNVQITLKFNKRAYYENNKERIFAEMCILKRSFSTCRSHWSSGITLACGARGPWIESRCGQKSVCVFTKVTAIRSFWQGLHIDCSAIGRLSLPPSEGP